MLYAGEVSFDTSISIPPVRLSIQRTYNIFNIVRRLKKTIKNFCAPDLLWYSLKMFYAVPACFHFLSALIAVWMCRKYSRQTDWGTKDDALLRSYGITYAASVHIVPDFLVALALFMDKMCNPGFQKIIVLQNCVLTDFSIALRAVKLLLAELLLSPDDVPIEEYISHNDCTLIGEASCLNEGCM